MTSWVKYEPVRLYLYGLIVPALAVLALTGWLDEAQTAAWVAMVAAVLAVPIGEKVRSKVIPTVKVRP